MNFQTDDRFLVTLVLIGSTELGVKVRRLKHLDQRITLRYHLNALDQTHTASYIGHRLRMAGQTNPLFTPEAIKLIFDFTRGTPREINNTVRRRPAGRVLEAREGDRRQAHRRGDQGHGRSLLMVRMSDVVRGIVRDKPADAPPEPAPPERRLAPPAPAAGRPVAEAPAPAAPAPPPPRRAAARASRPPASTRCPSSPHSPRCRPRARSPSSPRPSSSWRAFARSCARATRSRGRSSSISSSAARRRWSGRASSSGWPTTPRRPPASITCPSTRRGWRPRDRHRRERQVRPDAARAARHGRLPHRRRALAIARGPSAPARRAVRGGADPVPLAPAPVGGVDPAVVPAERGDRRRGAPASRARAGQGFPQGQQGAASSQDAKILGLIDTYTGLTMPPPPRPRLRPHEAIREIVRTKRELFPSALVKALLSGDLGVSAGNPGPPEHGRGRARDRGEPQSSAPPARRDRRRRQGQRLASPKTTDLSDAPFLYITGAVAEGGR